MELIAQDTAPQDAPDAQPEPAEIDGDALLRGEMTSAYDEHEAFDAPKDPDAPDEDTDMPDEDTKAPDTVDGEEEETDGSDV